MSRADVRRLEFSVYSSRATTTVLVATSSSSSAQLHLHKLLESQGFSFALAINPSPIPSCPCGLDVCGPRRLHNSRHGVVKATPSPMLRSGPARRDRPIMHTLLHRTVMIIDCLGIYNARYLHVFSTRVPHMCC
jgi:hypothetical protein